MIRNGRFAIATCVFVATCIGSIALAQPKKDAKKPKPKPAVVAPAAENDAGPKGDEERERAEKTGGDAAAAPIATETGDGGTRTSPLTPAPPEMPSSSHVDAGVVDYDRLLADLAALRTRVAAIGEGLFQSRMAVAIRIEGDRARVAKLSLSVDDGVVYTSPQGFRGDELTPVFARALAPGRHALTVEIEREDKENVAFKSAQRSRFIVEVPRDELLDVELRIEDDSTMGDLPSKKSGRYDLRVRVKANTSAIKK